MAGLSYEHVGRVRLNCERFGGRFLCEDCAFRQCAELPEFLPEHLSRQGLIPQLQVRLVERDIGSASRRETAVGVQQYPLRRDVLNGLPDAGGNLVWRVDVAAAAVDASQTDIEAFW